MLHLTICHSVKQGMHLYQAAGNLLHGGFSADKMRDAEALWGGAQSFFKGLKHMGQPQEDGVGEEHFVEDWATEHKRVFMFSGCKDDQTSADANIAGGHVGAMSWAFLEVMKKYQNISYLDILRATRGMRSPLRSRFHWTVSLTRCRIARGQVYTGPAVEHWRQELELGRSLLRLECVDKSTIPASGSSGSSNISILIFPVHSSRLQPL